MTTFWHIFSLELFCIFFRALGFCCFLPIDVLGKAGLGKLWLAFLAAIFFQFSQPSSNPLEQVGYAILGLEFVIGVVISLPLLMSLEIVVLLGELIDSGRGQTLAAFYDATANSQQSSLASLFRWGIWASLLASGIVELTLGHLATSLSLIPVGSLKVERLLLTVPLCLSYVAELFATAIFFYLPFAIIFLLVDLSVGLVGKLLPQLSLQAESFLVKTSLVFGVLLISLHDSRLPRLTADNLGLHSFRLLGK